MPYPPLRDHARPLFFKSRRRSWLGYGLVLLLLLVGAAALIVWAVPRRTVASVPVGPPHPLASAPPLPALPVDPAGNLFERSEAPPPSETRTEQVKPGETLAGILGAHLAQDKLAALGDPEDFSFSDLRSGQPYRLTLRDRELVSFEYDISPTETLVIDESDGELAARVETKRCEARPALLQATIHSSLYEAVTEAGGTALESS
ncbi:MAG: hypothetical protein ACLGQH_02100 [Acidobacteriota bacterium]